ncbi:Gfo/Idh/MocA family protein [Pseudofrankia saprophytica]|uniref:Gfo/Idh/MocA family protein n=1 Tax=Pseudofrankia saprophytica TaxID=298655 RepID=UPI0012FE8AC9|nr:Gfo/Idh/MocA family oxidoreductase [Pseudofrankia saprophytica]
MSESPFKVGIVGTGVGIRTHFPGFAAVPGVEIVGVVGSNPQRAAELLSNAGLPSQLACSLDELIASGPDLVAVTTPPAERGTLVGALSRSSCALLVEKPVARDADEASRIYQSILGSSRPVFHGVQLRGLPAFQYVRGIVQDGLIGRAFSVRLRERTSAFRADSVADWVGARSKGGGERLAMGPHLLDLGVFVSGHKFDDVPRPFGSGPHFGTAVTPRGTWISALADRKDAADEAFGCGLFVGGCWSELFCTGAGAGPRLLEFDIEGTEGLIQFSFVDGRGRLDVFTDAEEWHYHLSEGGNLVQASGSEPPKLNPSLFRVAFPSYANEIVATLRGVSVGPNLATLRDGIDTLAILDALGR